MASLLLARRAARILAAAAITVVSFAGAALAEPVTGSELRVEMGGYGPTVLAPGGSMFATVSIDNTALSDATDVSVSLRLTEQPILEREQLATWESGDWSPKTREVASRPVFGTGVVPAGTTTAATVAADESDLGLGARPFAVYGVIVRVDFAGTTIKEFRTFTTFLAETPSVTPLAVIATVAGSPERVAAVLTAAFDSRISLLVDPTAVAQAPDAPPIGSFRSVYSLPAGHVDVASLARARNSSLLAAALAASDSADAPGADRPWIAVLPSLDRASYDLAAAQGAAAVFVQPSAASTAPTIDGGGTPTPAFINVAPGGPLLIVPDRGLSLALSGSKTPAPLRAAAVAAESALLAQSNTDGRLVVASPGTSWTLESGTHRSSAVDELADLPWIRVVSLPDSFDGDPDAVVDVPDVLHDKADIPSATVARAAAKYRDLGYLATTSSDPASILPAPTAAILGALSFENRSDPDARAASLDKAIAAAQDVLDKVSLPSGSSLNLISTSGNVPITVSNDLDAEVTVTVVFEPHSPNLVVKGRPTVTLQPGTTQQVPIPVEAISSANVSASVHLTDGEGHRLTSDTPVRVRVRADWGTAFTAIVGGAGVLLLVGGIWRTLRRGRRGTRATPGDEPAAEGDGA